MKIGFIAAGAGDMLCGSCIRDNILAKALMRKGHDVLFSSLYTEICSDEETVKTEKQFFTGINVYLQQRFTAFRRAPWFLNSLFDSERLNRVLMKFGTDDQRLLAEMTKSMLRGSEGYQAKELKKLIEWFRDKDIEIFNLPNTLLSGLAGEMRTQLKVPVLSTLQGEDLFVDSFKGGERSEILELMREATSNLDGFISVSKYYAGFMHEFIGIPENKIDVVYNGINLEGYDMLFKSNEESFVIGYMARMSKAKGIRILIDALKILIDEGHDVKVRAAGWISKEDEEVLNGIRSDLKNWNMSDRFEYLGVVGRDDKIRHLSTCDVVSVPTEYKEPFGLYMLEALAAGTPVIQPNHGAFPELIKETGGGLLHKPFDPEDLARKIIHMIENPDERKNLAEVGRKNVRERFNSDRMAEGVLNIYSKYNYIV
jgi:glycosyltransferase involved in cell wall biosynthesis